MFRLPFLCAVMTAIMFSAWTPSTALAKDPFKGKWKVTITPDDDARKNGGKHFEDMLTFTGSIFTSQEMAKHGFKGSTYDQDTRGIQTAKFSASVSSEKEGRNEWQGTAIVDQMDGTLVWTKPDDTKLNFTFKGERISEKP